MEKDKTIYACYEEIKQREISELTEKVKAMGGQYVFPKNMQPFIMVNYDGGPIDERVGSVEIQTVSDNEFVVINNYDGEQIKLSDIAYGNICFITESIPVRTFSKESFCISRLSREDLETLGFDTSDIDDSTMQEIAEKLGSDYCEQLFWTSLEIIAEEGFDIPRKDSEDDDE